MADIDQGDPAALPVVAEPGVEPAESSEEPQKRLRPDDEAAPAARIKRKLPPPKKRTKGRGCGKNRCLGPTGEPAFPDKHPSWAARVRLANRQHKVVRRDLKSAKLDDATRRAAAASWKASD